MARTLTSPVPEDGDRRRRTGAPRFLTLADVAEVLNISLSQTKALVRSGDLPAIKIGGRGTWRVEDRALEDYIQRMYQRTREAIETDPEMASSGPEEDSSPVEDEDGPPS